MYKMIMGHLVTESKEAIKDDCGCVKKDEEPIPGSH